MLQLEYPWLLTLLPLPLLAWWLLPPYGERTRAVRVPFFDELAEATGQKPARGAVVLRGNWLRRILAPLCWALLVLALAGPQRLEPPVERTEAARDLLLAIDLSGSMAMPDFLDPQGQRISRLDAVKGVVDEFVRRRTTDRIGLIVFGTNAFPQAPLTLDHTAVRELLEELRVGMAGEQTAIGDAIGVAVKMTEHSSQRERVLILLTDGNDTAGRIPAEKAAEIGKANHIVIHTIGIGDPNAKGENRVDLDALKRIAAATGGRSFRGENREQLADIYALLDRMTPSKVKHSVYRPKVKLYYVPLGAALLLMIIYHLLMLGVFAPFAHRRASLAPEPSES
ncbi:Ca-activated chloride channel family protein [Dyella jiangningensis]|uniref:vWA domain-containing protein n=1 Tax=Dyella sp. AtDHG13 TaxID=1938897 RepID=UPI00088C9859|nr:VWA domain-containing protein [Dyella sp. AtDHG13]PXV59904.1 Ca-activated chloride channel family protein [Dyella sp. AtDHG13]SDJ18231.1 Ca-activated chloride channel family protein [Dyella jiangningensis]